MALADSIRGINLDTLAGKIGEATTLLGSARVTVTIDGQERELTAEGVLGLGPILDAAKNIPTTPAELGDAVKALLGELETLAGAPDLGAVSDVAARFGATAGSLRQLAEMLGGGADAVVQRLLGDLGGLDHIVGDIAGRLADVIPSELPDVAKVPVEALALLAGGVPDAAKLADILVRLTLGIELEKLRAPSLTIRAAVDAVATFDPGDLDVRLPALTAGVRAVTAMLRLPNPDVSAILTALGGIRAELDALFVDLPRLMGRFSAQINAVDTTRLVADLRAALALFNDLAPALSLDLTEVIEPLRAAGEGIDALTAAQLSAAFDEITADIRARIEASGATEVPELVDDFFESAVILLQRIGLQRMRDQVIDALQSVEARINGFAFTAPAAMTKALADVQREIAKVDTASIAEAIGKVKKAIEDLVAKVPIREIADLVTGQLDLVAEAVGQLVPALQAIGEQLDALADQVGNIDFSGAEADAKQTMTGIREKVQEALGSAEIPPPARTALGVAAAGLRQIDFRAEISAPISANLDSIDPALILAPLEPLVAEVRAKVASVSPAALIAQLDAPFNELLARLEPYKPSSLIAVLSQEFARLRELIERADPRKLVAPLEKEFEKLLDKVRAAADPAPLFAPLEALYAELQALVDQVDVEKIFAAVLGKLGGLQESVTGAAKGALQAKGGGAAAVQAAAEPFKFGDLLRPFAFLVQDLRAAVGKVPDQAVEVALTALAAPIAAVEELTDPERGFLAQVSAAIDAVRVQLDPARPGGPAAELAAALQELSVVAASVQLAGTASVQIGGGVASVQLDARFTLLVQARLELDDALNGLLDRLAPPDLAVQLRAAAASIRAVFPRELLAVGGTPRARLNAFFDAIDPTPFAAELDAIGERIVGRLGTFADELSKGLFRVLDIIFGTAHAVLPFGLAARVKEGMKRIREELAVLDPAPIEAEARDILESVLNVLQSFSPAALAEQLGGPFDALMKKLQELDPAALVGDTDALDAPFDALEQLKPSAVLGNVTGKIAEVQAALDALLTLKLGEKLVDAVIKLRATVEAILDDVVVEFEDLLAFLEGGGGAGVSGSVAV
jgi:hypothetical protein